MPKRFDVFLPPAMFSIPFAPTISQLLLGRFGGEAFVVVLCPFYLPSDQTASSPRLLSTPGEIGKLSRIGAPLEQPGQKKGLYQHSRKKIKVN